MDSKKVELLLYGTNKGESELKRRLVRDSTILVLSWAVTTVVVIGARLISAVRKDKT